jgi:hypothetical protein
MNSNKKIGIGVFAALLLTVSSQMFATAFNTWSGLTPEKDFIVIPFLFSNPVNAINSTNGLNLGWALNTAWGAAPGTDLWFVVGSSGVGGINVRHDFSTNSTGIVNLGVFNTAVSLGYNSIFGLGPINLEADVTIKLPYAALGNPTLTAEIAPAFAIPGTPVTVYVGFEPTYAISTTSTFSLNLYPGFTIDLGAQGFSIAAAIQDITGSSVNTSIAAYYYAFFQTK